VVVVEEARQHHQVAEDQVVAQAAAHQHHQVAADNLQARKQLVLGNKDPVKTQAGRAVGGLVEIKHLETPTILLNLVQKVAVLAVVKEAPVKEAPVTVTTRENLTNLSKTKAAKTKKKRVAERKLPVWLARLSERTSEVK